MGIEAATSNANNARESSHCCGPFASGSCAGGGRIGGRSVEVSFFANSISEIRIAGRDGRNRHRARFRSTIAIENFLFVFRADDFRQRHERRSDDIDAANELIRAPIRKNLVHDERSYLKCLGLATACNCESAGDIVN